MDCVFFWLMFVIVQNSVLLHSGLNIELCELFWYVAFAGHKIDLLLTNWLLYRLQLMHGVTTTTTTTYYCYCYYCYYYCYLYYYLYYYCYVLLILLLVLLLLLLLLPLLLLLLILLLLLAFLVISECSHWLCDCMQIQSFHTSSDSVNYSYIIPVQHFSF